jgi:hypothetical protein
VLCKIYWIPGPGPAAGLSFQKYNGPVLSFSTKIGELELFKGKQAHQITEARGAGATPLGRWAQRCLNGFSAKAGSRFFHFFQPLLFSLFLTPIVIPMAKNFKLGVNEAIIVPNKASSKQLQDDCIDMKSTPIVQQKFFSQCHGPLFGKHFPIHRRAKASNSNKGS